MGSRVRVVDLAKATHHNGKVGTVVNTRAHNVEGRFGVRLDGEKTVLAVRAPNLEAVAEGSAGRADAPSPAAKKPRPAEEEVEPRTLKRESQVLAEFAGTRDPDSFALYYHYADGAFDAHSVAEYCAQMARYYDKDYAVAAVVPRALRDGLCDLVSLRHRDETKNTLCELAFQCQRSFCGVSMLVRRNCANCGRPNADPCACRTIAFCSDRCKGEVAAHGPICALVRAGEYAVEDEVVRLL